MGGDSENTFICGRVKSEHFARLVYTVYIKVSKDSKLIDEVQCECAAGKGPTAHCKHVYVVCEGLKDFILTKTVLTRDTCTSRLQSFHQPSKKYTGSPIKAKNLFLKRPIDKKKLINFDPRPKKFRKNKNYLCYFRNKCISFAALVKETMPVLQIYKPANILGFYHDHDYEKLHPAIIFLKNLNLLDIDPIKRMEIEVSTRGQCNNKEWIYQRSLRINSSSFGQILQATNYESLVHDLLYPRDISHTLPVRHGKFYESHAIAKFEELTQIKTTECGTFVSLKKPFLAATPDRIVNNFCLEVKCPFQAKDLSISHKTVDCLEFCPGKGYQLKKEHNYYAQVQGQLFCTDKSHCYFIVYTRKDILILLIEKDEDFINAMVKKLTNFFNDHYMKGLLEKYFYKTYE